MSDKILLIPGPVSTNIAVRQAAMLDVAPWHSKFVETYTSVKSKLTQLAGGEDGQHNTVIIPGCGHFAMETILRSYISHGSKILIPHTGGYAERLKKLATWIGIVPVSMPVQESSRIDPVAFEQMLEENTDIEYVALIYSETSTGIVHNIEELSNIAARHYRKVVIDAVSAFGALPINLKNHPNILAIGATANKCLEALPGLGLITYLVDMLEPTRARSWSFNLYDMHEHEVQLNYGKARFTPPTNLILSLDKALDLLEEEGGPQVRLTTYTDRANKIYSSMRNMGLTPILTPDVQGPIVINVSAPNKLAWNVGAFSSDLYDNGVAISPWAPLKTPSFRIGCIGHLSDVDVDRALDVIRFILPKHFNRALT